MKFRLNQLLNAFLDNISFKLVAFFIALILWLTILGRRDFAYTKTMEIEFMTGAQLGVAAQTTDRVRVLFSGPRNLAKKFLDTNNQILVLDISNKGPGVFDVQIPISSIEVPQGVKVLSVRPSVIRAEVVRVDE